MRAMACGLSIALGLTVGMAVIACGGGTSNDPIPTIPLLVTTPRPLGSGGTETFEVTISNNAFEPQQITAKAGQSISIKVQNNDAVTHTLDIVDGPVSGPIFGGFNTSTALTLPEGSGTRQFFCSIHGRSVMSGTIVYQ